MSFAGTFAEMLVNPALLPPMRKMRAPVMTAPRKTTILLMLA